MNSGSEEFQRSSSDIVLFATIFVGFVIGISGLISTIVPAALFGFVLMGLGLCYFMLKN
jgi:hypothetical protein